MGDVITLKEATDESTYRLLEEKLLALSQAGNYAIVLYQGEGWCPDCTSAIEAFESIAGSVEENDIEFYSVFVGSKKEWKRCIDQVCSLRDNAFMRNKPHLQAVPTVCIYKGNEGFVLMANLTVLSGNNYFDHKRLLEVVVNLSYEY